MRSQKPTCKAWKSWTQEFANCISDRSERKFPSLNEIYVDKFGDISYDKNRISNYDTHQCLISARRFEKQSIRSIAGRCCRDATRTCGCSGSYRGISRIRSQWRGELEAKSKPRIRAPLFDTILSSTVFVDVVLLCKSGTCAWSWTEMTMCLHLRRFLDGLKLRSTHSNFMLTIS